MKHRFRFEKNSVVEQAVIRRQRHFALGHTVVLVCLGVMITGL